MSFIQDKTKTKIVSCYSIFIGISVIIFWIILLFGEKLPEGKTELFFHIFSELLMALLCIVSGVLLLKKKRIGKPLNIVGLGMAIYSVINAAGYYGEKNEFLMMFIFLVLLGLTIVVFTLHFKLKVETNHKNL